VETMVLIVISNVFLHLAVPKISTLEHRPCISSFRPLRRVSDCGLMSTMISKLTPSRDGREEIFSRLISLDLNSPRSF
jgi:hypothetical protein